jgi:D-alanine-D-alanine ligase
VERDGRFSFGPWRDPSRPASRTIPFTEPVSAAKALERLGADGIAVVFLALHGPFGEDGTVQGFLDVAGIPYTGSGVAASALAMDKANARHVLAASGVPVAKGIVLAREAGRAVDPAAAESRVLGEIGIPCVVKPNDMGSSVGVSVVKRREDLAEAIPRAFEGTSRVLVEEFVPGIELTCGVLGNARSGSLVALPPTEIRAPEGRFFDYDVKYRAGAAVELTPAPIDAALERRVRELALRAHESLSCRGLARTDFRVRDGREPVALEVNTLPGMTETSLFPQAAAAAGIPFPLLLTRLVELALEGRLAAAT